MKQQLRHRYNTDLKELQSICEVTFIKAGGPGGQHRNKRETGVRLFHPPSRLTVCAVERRSQSCNLQNAYERLIEKLSVLNRPKKLRKPTRIPRATNEKRLEKKRRLSRKKALRSRNFE